MSLGKKSKIIFSALLLVLSLLMVAQVALAATGADKAIEGLDKTGTTGFGGTKESLWQGGPAMIIGKIIGAGLAFLGVIFFCLILYAGLSWILSMGNEEKINEAKNMIIAAVLGLLVVLGAYAITTLLAKIFTEAIPS